MHGPFLSDAMSSVLCLEVCLGVPVAIVEDNRVCGLEVDAQPPGAGREEEDELGGVGLVVGIDELLADSVLRL